MGPSIFHGTFTNDNNNRSNRPGRSSWFGGTFCVDDTRVSSCSMTEVGIVQMSSTNSIFMFSVRRGEKWKGRNKTEEDRGRKNGETGKDESRKRKEKERCRRRRKGGTQ